MTPRDRSPIIGGNWKMNTTMFEAESLAQALVSRIDPAPGSEVVICPPFTNLQLVGQILASGSMSLGAQDVFWADRGAYTGEISPPMLTSLGVRYVIVGHSERRQILGESSEIVNKKARAAIDGGLRVILAVGEMEPERTEDRTEDVLAGQLEGSLEGMTDHDLGSIVVAYEPVWAIGTGLTATPDQAQAAHAFIRGWLSSRYGPIAAGAVRIQYGGSVTGTNAADLLRQPDIDGALVGGASLRAEDFAAIVEAQNRLLFS